MTIERTVDKDKYSTQARGSIGARNGVRSGLARVSDGIGWDGYRIPVLLAIAAVALVVLAGSAVDTVGAADGENFTVDTGTNVTVEPKNSAVTSTGELSETARMQTFNVTLDRGDIEVGETTTFEVEIEVAEQIGGLAEVETVEDIKVENIGHDHPNLSVSPTEADVGDLTVGKSETVTFDVTQTTEDELFFTLRITGNVNGTQVEQLFSRSIKPEDGNKTDWVDTPEGEPSPITSGTESTPTDKVTNDSVSTQATATVTGTWYYLDGNDNKQPCKRCWVEVKDNDPVSDGTLASGRTDANGDYSFSFDPTNSGATEFSNVDVYVKVYADNGVVEVKEDGIYPNPTYSDTTETENDVQDGAYISFSNTVSENKEAWQIAEDARTARDYILDETGWTRDSILTRWPADKSEFMKSPISELDEYIKIGSDWDSGTVYQEYGHAVMYSMYGDSYPDTDDYNNRHCLHSHTDPGFAVVEGWSAFVWGAVADDSTEVRHSYLNTNIEINT
ncbi:hypothetical protein EGH25_00155 [Haladaptatus sp. F3-133]|uniref:Uncharacterized protein n=1 Tax=Halorutilus salinus TaxID=2487751 RepID=A0A9Q4GFP7_9EURY|nr:hypothetical protein [Halorutilus salinus]MCX2817777.1 hypothetical protein [Halorutilus salinus]